MTEIFLTHSTVRCNQIQPEHLSTSLIRTPSRRSESQMCTSPNISRLDPHGEFRGFCTALRKSQIRKTRCKTGDGKGWSRTRGQSHKGQLGDTAFAQPRLLTITFALPPTQIFHPQFEILKVQMELLFCSISTFNGFPHPSTFSL